jgi:hypothetical protein
MIDLIVRWLDSNGRIACFLGLHQWRERSEYPPAWRECRHCLRLHSSSALRFQ